MVVVLPQLRQATRKRAAPESLAFVFELPSTSLPSGGAALVVRPSAPPAVGIDRNLIVWKRLGESTALAYDTPLDAMITSDDATNAVETSALWEDNAWVASLKAGI